MKYTNQQRDRQGVILLVVLSLLAMFALLVTTFVVVAGNYRTAAVVASQATREGESPQKLLDNVMFSVLTDTTDLSSPLQGHSLLRDIYGDDGFVAQVQAFTPLPTTTAGQFFVVRLYFNANVPYPLDPDNMRDYTGRAYRPRLLDGYYNGRVLSFVSGESRGVSTRIISYNPVTMDFRLMVTDTSAAGQPRIGDRVVINGRAFSGTGVGFNPLSNSLDSPDPGPDGEWGVAGVDDDGANGVDDIGEARFLGSDDLPPNAPFIGFTGGAALLPNRATHVDSQTGIENYLRGHADESYDAADYQNFHLAAAIPKQTANNFSAVLPSYHRPALMNFWIQNLIRPAMENELMRSVTRTELLHSFLMPYGPDHDRNTAPPSPPWPNISLSTRDSIVKLKQQVITRPLPEMHPAFTGSNPAFSLNFLQAAAAAGFNPYVDFDFVDLDGDGVLEEYFWDVDNDGDGDPDGIWMDVGLPIREDEDGKTYKPLVSIHILDLDGRFNLNTHGSPGHILTTDATKVQHPTNLARNGNPFTTLVTGHGTGPADINLRLLFSFMDPTPLVADPTDLSIQYNHYQRLMFGAVPPTVPTLMTGRYGFDQRPGIIGTDPNSFTMWPNPALPNQGPVTRDFLSQLKFWEYPRSFYGGDESAFQSPPDLHSELVVGLDHRGAPTFSEQRDTIANSQRLTRHDNPYETNVFSPSSDDRLFTIAELEGLLRIYDNDVSPSGRPLPQRLTMLFENNAPPAGPGNLFTTAIAAPLARRSVTTHSVDLPVPNILDPPDIVANVPVTSPLYSIMKPQANLNAPRVHQEFRFHHVTDILRARLIQGFGWGNDVVPPTSPAISPASLSVLGTWNYPPPATTPPPAFTHDGRINTQLASLLAPNLDLALGTRMDINRPFGNGEDDNLNHVVDDYGLFWPGGMGVAPFRFLLESGLGVDRVDNDGDGTADEIDLSEVETSKFWDEANGIWQALPFDHDNDGVIAIDVDNDGQNDLDQDAFTARVHFARHLYILGQMLIHPDWAPDMNGDGTPDDLNHDGASDYRDRARAIAQWAINVVDMRDADAIMTPFEYDMQPFTPKPGADGAWGEAGTDDDGINGTDDIGEALWPGTDDVAAWGVDGALTIHYGLDGMLGTADDPETDPAGPGPDGIYGTNDDPDTERDVVWGTERPELLLTETLAFHDRRTDDLAESGFTTDPMGEMDATMQGGPGDDYDQKLRPRGSFFVEIYNPHTSNGERKPAEFYHTGGAYTTPIGNGVLLDKLNSSGDAIWRMSVTTHMDDPDPSAGATAVIPPDPDNPSPNRSGTEGMKTERLIYFSAPATPPSLTNYDSTTPTVFTNPLALAPVLAGRYAVVGTYRNIADHADPQVGTTDGTANEYITPLGRNTVMPTDLTMTRRILLHHDTNPDLNWVYVEDNAQTPPAGRTTVPSRVLSPTSSNSEVVDAQPPVAIPIANLNISEGTYPAADSMGNAYDEASGGYMTPYDLPFDEDPSLVWDRRRLPNSAGGSPPPAFDTDETIPNLRYVHLQRLANPLLPYHPVMNPYRTVDSLPVDLTIYNGIAADSGPSVGGGTAGDYTFDTRERGTTISTPPNRNLWSRNTRPLVASGAAPIPSHHFNRPLTHSLGFMNRSFGQRFEWDYSPMPSQTTAPLEGYIGSPDTRVGFGATFPWLNWPNRPYISAHELVQVPWASSAQLLESFNTVVTRATPTAADSPFSTDPAAGPGRAEFNHLVNFHNMTVPGLPSTGANSGNEGMDLAMILDFVHVPSRFVGAETLLPPNLFRGLTGLFSPPFPQPLERAFFNFPFNKVPTFREPGKVNVNTIYNRVIWDGVRGGLSPSGVGPGYDLVVDSRRGFGERPIDPSGTIRVPPEKRDSMPANQNWIKAGTTLPQFHPLLPNGNPNPNYDPVIDMSFDFFANPFRGFGGATLVPWPARWSRPLTETSLLRSNRFDVSDPHVATNATPFWPILPQASRPPTDPDPDIPLFARLGGAEHLNGDRNSYFRYEAMQRINNLVTTRSNVYAVWITVGFFEVEQRPPLGDPPPPNTPNIYLNRFGYQLGNENGWDTGDVTRHRGFYIIDRSIPVAFEPGAVHNTENAILLRRFIE